MTILNQRWPNDLIPEACQFGRSRNDQLQVSPRTRETHVIRMGRPLWSAELSWTMPSGNTLAKLRYWLEELDGFAGSVQIWNFAAPHPMPIGTTALPTHWQAGSTVQIAAGASINATSVALKGLQASQPAVKQGQPIQIGRRIYIAAADVNADGSGNATVGLTGGLLAAAVTNDIVRLRDAACEMRLAEQSFTEETEAQTGWTRIRASFVETVTDFA
jgi:hypothetical protein